DELGDLPRLLTDDDVGRHDGAGEATVVDRVQDPLDALGAGVEVGAVGQLARPDVRGRAEGPGGSEGVASGAALLEELGAAVVRVVPGDFDSLLPAGGEGDGQRQGGGKEGDRL